MNKTEFVKRVSSITHTPQGQVRETLNAILDVIGDALIHSEDVTLTGFGKFYTVEHQSRTITLPTGEERKLDTKTIPRFKSGATLKRLVSERA